MTEERLEPAENSNHALKIVQFLIDFEYPKDPRELPTWLKKVRFLQTYLNNCWKNDFSDKVMLRCLNLLYSVIAHNKTPVGPAVWCVLDLVVEQKIVEFVDGILADSATNDDEKVHKVLKTMIEGLGQAGPYAKKLQDWIFAMVNALENRGSFALLTKVSESVMPKLMDWLLIQDYRILIYPTFRQFLYPVISPHIFEKIIDKIPELLALMESDVDDEEGRQIFLDFIGLLRAVMKRFFPHSDQEIFNVNYNIIKISLMKYPESTFDPDLMSLWDPSVVVDPSDWISLSVDTQNENSAILTPYKGLLNQGNTCFMNSVLQMLFMTPRFRKEVLEKEFDPTERAAIDIQQLFALMRDSNRTLLIPSVVLETTIPPTFRRGLQQDSSEYLIYLLDLLHEDELSVIRRKKYGYAMYNSSEYNRERNMNFDEGAGACYVPQDDESSTIVERLFGGTLMSTTICSHCKGSFPKNDDFRNLHVCLPDDQPNCDLQSVIDISLEPEALNDDNMYDCEACGTKRNAVRKHTVIKAPEHLILTLKVFRFDPIRKQRLKLHTKLRNAKNIEIPVYDTSRVLTHIASYDLKGVVLHSGSSIDGGHYLTAAVDQSGQWYIFNDSLITIGRRHWCNNGGTAYMVILRLSEISDPPESPLSPDLQEYVNRDNQNYRMERRYSRRGLSRRRDFEDGWDDTPPNNETVGGGGPSLVF